MAMVTHSIDDAVNGSPLDCGMHRVTFSYPGADRAQCNDCRSSIEKNPNDYSRTLLHRLHFLRDHEMFLLRLTPHLLDAGADIVDATDEYMDTRLYVTRIAKSGLE
jgi:hypothetical protein